MKNHDVSEALGGYSISGLLVHTRPEVRSDVMDRLSQLQGVEVHIAEASGKLIVTVEEEPGERTMIEGIERVRLTAGVVSTALIYTHTEQA
ncbi:hypothetical protein GCM10023116_07990 [Kistimonas scapharcae]|uniref:Chaperone NapD n=1 Tax=Kistimonas scapharcae TaxID=1036133 RepID=A0ABP8V088_9GAMM